MIRLQNLTKSFDGGTTRAVDGISLHVKEGEFFVLLGESGCGKTTTLKMINRLVPRSSGTIEVGGVDIANQDPIQLRRRIGYVFQGIGLFPHMTVSENIGAVPRLLGWPRNRILDRTRELLDMVGLPESEFARRYPHELSGGQQQRIGVARALAAGPRVLLMDEPFGALDPMTRDELQRQFKDLHERLGLTVILVTHDITEALLLADRIIVMQGGRIAGQGSPSELMTGATKGYVRSLMAMPKRQADRIEALTEAGA